MAKDLVKDAFLFALEAHGKQMHGDRPYIAHLWETTEIIKNFMDNPYRISHNNFKLVDVLAAGWLHDVLEDTDARYGKIGEYFGKTIAEIVYACTDELGRNRHERHEKTYPKMDNFHAAQLVKLADRIANAKASTHASDGLLSMYRDEYPRFRELFHDQFYSDLKDLWDELDHLMRRGKL